jgi:hypothetical protein
MASSRPSPGPQLTATSNAVTDLSATSGAIGNVQWDTVVDAHVTDQSGGVGHVEVLTLSLHNADDDTALLPTDVHVRVTVTVLAPDGTVAATTNFEDPTSVNRLANSIDDKRTIPLATCTTASCDVHETVRVHLERLDDLPVRLHANLSVSDVFDYGIQGCGTPGEQVVPAGDRATAVGGDVVILASGGEGEGEGE